MTEDKGKGKRIVVRDVSTTAACARDARAWDRSATSTSRSSSTTASRSTRGRSRCPATRPRAGTCASSRPSGLDPDKPIRKYTKKERDAFLYQEPTKVKVEKLNLTYEGLDPADPEVVPVEGRRRAAAAHPGVRGTRGHLHHLSRVRRHPAQRGRPLLEDPGEEHRRRLRDADQRPGRVGARAEGAVRRAAAGGAGAHARLVRGDRAGLPQPRPAVRHAVGR